MKEINHKEFNEGAVDSINPDLGVADQAYLLPYNPNWEFPKDRLKFGTKCHYLCSDEMRASSFVSSISLIRFKHRKGVGVGSFWKSCESRGIWNFTS